MGYLNLLTVAAETPLGEGASFEDGFKQAAVKVEPHFSPEVTEYNVAVPSKTVRVRLNGMSYTAAAVKIDGMIGNMRVLEFTSDSAEFHMTLHDQGDALLRTYTFKIQRTTADMDDSLVTEVNIAPPPPPMPAGHGHSHGDGGTCTIDHGDHGHGDGAKCTHDHGH
eukprot:CAMPEP_0118936224 /NCGR_PEP_ID=MMETSP1169-20130426/17441_1 /TAXON_ID=36882 /ORGANISM="Pyramimonas obovata, Strain CCMP722" /LENGTH=165 /DNA_ID=CAMNT_0006879393 /DNA_START=60 /DNA_END=554 /DNA_ORIENTATION=+